MFNEAYDGNYIQIDREILRANAAAVTAYVKTPVIAVVKFDGYGMTVAEAARAWQAAGAAMFAVAESWEAMELRNAGFTEDILLMAPVADKQTLVQLLDKGVILTAGDLNCARFYLEHKGDRPLRVHVKVDTGMGRFGVRWTDMEQLKAIYALEGISFEGIFSHFGKSFEKEYKLTKLQLDRFLETLDKLAAEGIAVGTRHIANSCAALRFPETRLDAVRVGSALVNGLLAAVPVPLKTAHVIKARVVAVKQLKKGDTTGYATVCKAKRNMTAAVVNIGFNVGFGMTGAPDPYPLIDFASYMYHLLQRYLRPPAAAFDGKSLPLTGRVGSQYTLFETAGADIKPGDYVTVRIPLLQYPGKRIFIN